MERRYRSRGAPNSYGESLIVNHYQNAPDRTSTSNRYLLTTDTEEMWDYTTPEFYKRIRRGELIINPMARKVINRTAGGGVVEQRYVGGTLPNGAQNGTTVTGGSVTALYLSATPVTMPALSVDAVKALGTAKLNALAGVDKSAANLMESVLSIRQSIQGLGTVAGFLEDAVKAIKRRDGISLLANGWLRHRMELMPTISDMGSILNAICDGMDSLCKDVRLRSTGTGQDEQSWSGTLSNSTTIPGFKVSYRASRKLSAQARACVYYRVKSNKMGWRRHFGLRAKDFPVGLWNVVPFSFLFDRFYDISAVLTAIGALTDPDIYIEGGSATVRTYDQQTIQLLDMVWTPPNWTASVSGDTIRTNSLDKTRSPYDPGDFLGLLLSEYRGSLRGLVSTANRTADLVALVAQTCR